MSLLPSGPANLLLPWGCVTEPPAGHLSPAQPCTTPPALLATPDPTAAQTCPHPERQNLTVTNASSSIEEEEEAHLSPVLFLNW